jgi:RHS repeat-associated protein
MDWQNSVKNGAKTYGRLAAFTHSFTALTGYFFTGFTRHLSLLRPVFSPCLALFLLFALVNSTLAPFTFAKDARTPEGSKSKAAPRAQGGDNIIIFGPRRFEKPSKQPATFTAQFALPQGVQPPYTMLLQNGTALGTGRVSGGVVTLNGVQVLNGTQIKATAYSVLIVVNLQPSNQLQINLTGPAGSFVTISVIAMPTVVPPARLTSVDPVRATQGQTRFVTLQGENTHWLAGETRASFGPEISVAGAAPGELGPVMVTSPTTAIAEVTVAETAALSPRTVRVVAPKFVVSFPEGLKEESVELVDGFTVVASSPPGASSTKVATIVGLAGSPGFADGIGSQARFNSPAGVATGAGDSIVVADAGNHRIRAVRTEPDQSGVPQWVVSTLAGDGVAGFADGPAATARFNNPQGVAVNSSGVVFIADTANNRIRKIALDQTVTTIAGDGTAGFQDGPGSQARFNAPRGLAVDHQGNIYVADTGNAAVRVINLAGQVSTLAGDGTIGANDSPGARFNFPSGVAVNGSNIYVYLSDKGNHRIRRLDVGGTVITLAGSDRGFADGSPTQARFAEPTGIAFDGSGRLLVTDAINSLIRQVDPALAATGSTSAVTTLAGSGERGATDGPGSQATFLTPRGISAMASSAVVVADSGNHTLRQLQLPPVITSLSPQSVRPAETVTINGARFDGRGPERNTVRFTRAPEAGGGQIQATVTAATQTSLLVVVPDDARSGPVTVQTEGGTAVSPTSLEVLPPMPVISGFSPQSGAVGSAITLTGQFLKAPSGDPNVTFTGRGNTRLPSLVTFASSTEVQVLVPNAAVTGRIQLTNVWGQATSNQDFTVNATQDFQVSVAPSTATAVQRTAATYVVQVTSNHATFTQLTLLTLSGLPAGVEATFEPSQITAGASSILTLNLANANLAAGSYSFTINAAAEIDGNEAVRSVPANLSVLAAGQTTLSGRVMSTDNEPIVGATISLDGQSATSDAAGTFLLSGVTAGLNRPVMIDGRTASAPNRTYPVLAEPANIVAGEANAVPYVFYLPPIDVQQEVILVPGQTNVITTPRVPGIQLTVPANANLRNRDNTPVTRVSITPVPIDRTPTPLPPNTTTAMVYTNQPGGAISDVPMPMVFPNLQGADPGTRADLYAFNHDTVQWYVYGYGRVSADGRLIVPEIDPATGQPYGLVDFSWYYPSVTIEGNPGDWCDCPRNSGDKPVDLSTGAKIESMTDVSIVGPRGSLTLTRIFSSDLNSTMNPVVSRFGRGTKDNFDIRLRGLFGLGGTGRIVFPQERIGRLFSYQRTDPNGAHVFTTTATIAQLGDEIRQLTDGTFEYRFATGDVLRFDSQLRLIAMVDRNANTTTLTYSGQRLTTVTDPVGRSLTFEYDNDGFVERVNDSFGRRWLYSYSSSALGRQVASVTDPMDNVVRYTYVAGPMVSITDGRGHIIKSFDYDPEGRVIRQTFADGSFETYTYQTSGTIVTAVSIRDSLGRVESKRFNWAGYVIGLRDPMGQTATITRDIQTHLKVEMIGSCGCVESINEYDSRGNLIASTDRLGQTARWEYEPVFNNVTRFIDRMNRETTYSYDSRGNLTSITNTLNQTTRFVYDEFGQLKSITDPLNHTTSVEYDTSGNLTAAIDQLNQRSTFEYDAIGRMTAAVDALNRRRSVTYDALDRVETATDANSAITTYTYDANSNLTSSTNALGQRWQWTYDEKDRLSSTTDPLNRLEHFVYNTDDELIEIRSRGNRIKRYGYDDRGRTTTITDPLNQVIRLGYDNRGNLTSMVDKRGHTTTFQFDELDRLIGRRNALGQFTTVSYNAVNKVTSFHDTQGRHASINYDDLDRPLNITYPDATVTYTYDNAGRTTRIDDTQGGSIQWSYDDANRTLSETTSAGVITYSYNAANQRASMTASGASPVNYGYDTAGRLQTITQGTDVFTFAYDTLSRLSSVQRPNGVTSTYAYDIVSRLKRLTDVNASNQSIHDLRFTYTLDNQISSVTSLGAPQLLPAAKTGSTPDAANRMTQFGPATYSFDSLGHTTAKSDSEGTTTYQWDARGRLTGATLPGGQSVSYGYDALGRRATRTANGVTTQFLYDGADVVRDIGSDNSAVDYLNGPGIDNKLRQSSAGTGSLYFLQDHLGSTKALTDAGGGVVEQNQYEAFGESSGASLSRYGFTGRERDELTGLLHYRARWYDPQQGRFISQDPIGFEGGDSNLYAYGLNNPVSFKDPMGEAAVVILIIGAVVLILLYPKFANAPGHGDPIYNNDPMGEMVGDIPSMVLGGVFLRGLFGLLGRCITPIARRLPKIGPYKELRKTLPKGEQANHLNQNAAYRDVIPEDQGLAVGMRGNAFTEPGTPHYEFHKSLEKFWDQFRKGGSQAGTTPTNAQYDDALKEALKSGGFSGDEAAKLAREAASQRASHGLKPGDPVPRVPGKMYQKCF